MTGALAAMPFIESNDLLEARDAIGLRERAAREGYLFFKGLLPPADILRVRRDMLAVVERFGWLQTGTDPQEGRLDMDALNQVPESEMRVDIGVNGVAYEEVQKLESFHALPHHPNLIGLYELLFGGEVLVHPRHIARMVTGHPSMVPTPQHQDFPLIQGTSNTWTCWFPLGDCPRSRGGLTVLRGSHHNGYLPVQVASGAGGISAQLCAGEDQWVEGDYECGDVLTFPCYTVHKALPAQEKQYIRLSLDVRFQPVDEVVESKSLLPHCGLSWDEIYAGWESEAFQRYWEKLPLQLSAWDDSLMQPSRRIC